MRAIILTYAPVTKEEAKLLKNADVFKIATNFSAAELKPNLRLCADNIVQKCLDCDTCDVVSVNHDLERERVINACYLPKRHSTLLYCIDYLYLKGYSEVLLVATNPDSATSKINYIGVNGMKDCLYLYKYTKDGNLDIPYKSVKEFLSMTDEERLLGEVELAPKKLIEKTIFTDSCRYEVQTIGRDNKSIESGAIIASILPYDIKEQFLYGVIDEVDYNGLHIKKITQLVPKKEEVKEEETIKPVKKTVKKKVKK